MYINKHRVTIKGGAVLRNRSNLNVPARFNAERGVALLNPAEAHQRAANRADKNRMDEGGARKIDPERFKSARAEDFDKPLISIPWIKDIPDALREKTIKDALLDFGSVTTAENFYKKLVEYFPNTEANNWKRYRSLPADHRGYQVREVNDCKVRAWCKFIDTLGEIDDEYVNDRATNLEDMFVRRYRDRLSSDGYRGIRNFRNPINIDSLFPFRGGINFELQ
jgi:hypothetical protein